jgi:predicted XRE-type DNA-binding protein
MNSKLPTKKSDFLLYTAAAGKIKIDVFVQDETVWLTQKAMAELFGVKTPAVSKHLANIFETGELKKGPTISILETVQAEGNRKVSRKARSDFGFLPVLCQLRFRQWCATSPFSKYFASVPEIIKPLFRLFRMIRAVGKHIRVRVLRIKERFKHVGIVHLCRCRHIVSNDFMLCIYRCVILIAEKGLIVLLRPPCINILLAKFRRMLLSATNTIKTRFKYRANGNEVF